METRWPTKDQFMEAHKQELGLVLAERPRISSILAAGTRKSRYHGAAEVCLRIEFQAGYEGHDPDYIETINNSFRLIGSEFEYDETVGMAVRRDLPGPQESSFDRELYNLGIKLRSVVLNVLPENSSLRKNPNDFSWLIRIALAEIILSQRN